MASTPANMPGDVSGHSRRDRFLGGYTWLILRNVIGWSFILGALVAGPLIPGPGGIPLFLIGFALATIPGKRRLTVRVLRGRPIRFLNLRVALSVLGLAAVLVSLAVLLLPRWSDLIHQKVTGRPIATLAWALAAVAALALAVYLLLYLTNLLLRIMPRIRRRVRPWFRRHHIRLLPPRWRRRSHLEPGRGPLRLREEILKLGRRRPQ